MAQITIPILGTICQYFNDFDFLAQQVIAFYIQRIGMQEFMTMVVPIFLISWVAMLAIIVPESSGEKIGFCVAIDLGLIFLKASLNADLSAPLKNQSQGFK